MNESELTGRNTEEKTGSVRSRLWVKVFSVVIVIVIFMMTVFVTIWQRSTIHYVFDREEKKITENQAYISNALINAVSFSVLSEGMDILPDSKIKSLVQSAFYYNTGEVALFYGDELISSTYQDRSQEDQELLKVSLGEENCYIQLYHTEDKKYVKTVSGLTLQEKEYRLITTTDLSELYSYEKNVMKQVIAVCVAGGQITAFVLIFVFHFAFRPLRKINDNVSSIASGNYDYRLDVSRDDELGELAQNVNEMAQVVGDNIRSLRESSAKQQRFVQNLSHEMKTPLTSIICYAELMRVDESITEQKQKEFADVIVQEGKRLRTISAKLMDFLYIGKVKECDKKRISIKALLEEIETTIQPVFEKNGVILKKQVEDFQISVDPELFRTMLYNYLDNAVKASRRGGIVEVDTYLSDGKYMIEVVDHGVGIPEDEIGKIEEPFYMVDKSRSRKAGGAGLGLALCRKIVVAHEGKVTIKSRLKEGTIIRLEFLQDSDIE